MSGENRRRTGWPSIFVVALMVGLIAAAVVAVWPGGHGTPTVTDVAANNKAVAAPKPAVDAAKHALGRHVGLGNDYATPAQLRADDAAASPRAPRITGPIPLAAPHQRGCVTRSNTANFSYRNGVRPSIGVEHLTVSRNIANSWDDVNGVWIFLNRPSTQASANYIVDAEAKCVYAISESYKAWAQANLNSASACAIEQINTGSEATYGGVAGLRQNARIVHDCFHRWHIPLRRAAVIGGVVVRSGLIDHYHLGIAGGGHVDIHAFGPGCRLLPTAPGTNAYASVTWGCVDTILAMARALDRPPITADQRQRCQELNRIRTYARKNAWTPMLVRRANAIKRGEARNHLACRFGPPGRLTRS